MFSALASIPVCLRCGLRAQDSHSLEVEKDRSYLHPLDLVLLAELRQKHLCVVSCEDGRPLQIQSMRKMISEIAPEILSIGLSGSRSKKKPVVPEDLEVNLSSKTTWIAVYCNFANGRSSDLALNHFMAGWRKDQLGPDVWDDCCRRAREERRLQAKEIQRKIKEVEQQGPAIDQEMLGIEVAQLQQSMWRHESRCSLMEELQEIGLYCEDVPGDGDCALRTLVGLSTGKPKCLRSSSWIEDLAVQKMRLRVLRQEPSAL